MNETSQSKSGESESIIQKMESHHRGAESSSSGANLLSRIALNDNKAGMEGLDRDKINKIILETSKVCTAIYLLRLHCIIHTCLGCICRLY